VSTDQPTPPREKKPRSTAASLAGIRVASDEEIKAAARAEVARIRAEIAQQKLKEGAAAQDTKPAKKETPSPEAPLRRKTAVPSPAEKAPKEKLTTAAKPVISSAPSIETSTEPQSETPTTAAPTAKPQTTQKPQVSLKERLASRKKPTPDFNIKRWEPSPEELELLRARKIRRLRVAVAISGAAFIGLLAIIVYLSTGGLVHPTQGVTTEWGTASQVNTLVDKMATPHAGNHVIVHLPGKANKDALVLGFLQGFDGNDYLVTIGADTIVVPREDFVGTVTAIWPSLF
jgi:hypothetical protein